MIMVGSAHSHNITELPDGGRDINAPIVFFVYNRPWHTRQAVEALKNNALASQTDLIIFSDAPKTIDDAPNVREVRSYIRSIVGFKSIRIVEREINLGLANSIIDGVTKVCGEYGRLIVIEDDLVTSPYFLRYMNDALDTYANDDAVASIHGYWYHVDQQVPETFLLRGASCWGWATWSRGWQLFEPDGAKLLTELHRQELTKLFDLDGAISYTRMLRHQIAGKNNSWAIRWHAATFLANRLQLSPGRSLVRNIGFDGTGTHCTAISGGYDTDLATTPVIVKHLELVECKEARAVLIRYYRKMKRNIWARVLGRLRRMVAI